MYKHRGKKGSTIAVFESTEEADNAFERLEGVSGQVFLSYLLVYSQFLFLS